MTTRRVLALGCGRDWRGAIGPVLSKQESVAGLLCSWSSRRTIATSTVPPQLHTTSSPASAFAAFPLPAASVIRDLGEVAKKAERSDGWLARTLKDFLATTTARVEAEARTASEVKMEEYKQYLERIAKEGLLTEDVRTSFLACPGESTFHEEYEPWKKLLHVLFPKEFGYRVSQDKFFTGIEEEAGLMDPGDFDPFIVVRRRAADGSWPVVLLGRGFARQYKEHLPARFPSVVGELSRTAQLLVNEGQARPPLAMLAFFAEDFCWHIQLADGKPRRQGHLYDARETTPAAQRALFQIAEYVQSLHI